MLQSHIGEVLADVIEVMEFQLVTLVLGLSSFSSDLLRASAPDSV